MNKLQDNEILMGESGKGTEKAGVIFHIHIPIFHKGSKSPVEIPVDLV